MAPRPIDVVIHGKNESQGAFAEVTRSAEELEGKITALNRPFEALKNVVAGVAGFMVVDFFRKTVEASAEAEQAWSRVASAVSNAGIRFDGVQGGLEKLFATMSKTSRFSERDLSDAFGTLLNVTNDYRSSVDNLDLVTNIAVARHMDLNQAATLVGRVIDGNTSMLKRYGIVLRDDGIAPMDQLRERFKGFAEKDAETLGGALARLGNAWEKIQEAIGKSITGESGGKGLDGLIDRMARLASFIEGHSATWDRIERLFNAMGAVQQRGIEQFSPFARMMNRATGDTPGGVPELQWGSVKLAPEVIAQREIDVNSAKATAQRKADAEKEAQKEILDAVRQRIHDVHELEKQEEEAKKAHDAQLKQESGELDHSVLNTETGLQAKDALRGLRVETPTMLPKVGIGGDAINRKQLAAQLKDLGDSIDTVIPRALGVATGAVQNFAAEWGSAVDAIITHHEKLGAAIISTGRHAIGQVLVAQGQAALLKAGEAAAEGLWPPNPALLAKAARLLAVGTAEVALGDVFGGGAGGGGGSYGGGGLGGSSFQSQQSAINSGNRKATVVFKGGAFLNLADPEQRAEFIANLRELAGDADLDFLFE